MLHNTLITDNGLIHVAGLKDLHMATLSNTKITDTGLVHLKRLQQLEQLDVAATHVTGQALKRFQEVLPGVSISFWPAASIDLDELHEVQVSAQRNDCQE